MLQSGCNGYVSDRFGWRLSAQYGSSGQIRFVRFLVDLLKCEATYRFLISGNLHALKNIADSNVRARSDVSDCVENDDGQQSFDTGPRRIVAVTLFTWG
jgi:hypothetical protein